MQNRAFVLSLAAVLIAAVACDSTNPVSKIVTFKATINGASEVPATTSSGVGSFTATLDTSTNVFIYSFTYSGLSSNSTAGHLHAPASATGTANPTIDFATLTGATFVLGATSGSGGGQTTLNAANNITTTINGDSLRKLLFSNNTYVNIHTVTNGGGEIRGQVIKQ